MMYLDLPCVMDMSHTGRTSLGKGIFVLIKNAAVLVFLYIQRKILISVALDFIKTLKGLKTFVFLGEIFILYIKTLTKCSKRSSIARLTGNLVSYGIFLIHF